jgi:hypothetical protein
VLNAVTRGEEPVGSTVAEVSETELSDRVCAFICSTSRACVYKKENGNTIHVQISNAASIKYTKLRSIYVTVYMMHSVLCVDGLQQPT